MTSKKLGKLSTLWLVMGIILSLCSCGAALAAPIDEPSIDEFYATPVMVQAGETVLLTWKTTNVSEIQIIGIEREPEEGLPLSGSIETWPLATTSYVLIAKGLNGMTVSKSVTVNVDVKGSVAVDYFKASSTLVAPGEKVRLAWRVVDGKKVRILSLIPKADAIIGNIEDGIEVAPLVTTTYLLEATGVNGEVASAALTINVQEMTYPEILTFTASKYIISKGELISLSWTTKNATGCKIVTDSGQTLPNRPPNGSISVTPNKTIVFTLVAYNEKGYETRQSVTITVK